MFKRLYNWIKFKTLPSSILFKNRLFVERDSKHRRVMSNFGLTFRNSKWSDYAIKNITMTSLTSFTRLVRNVVLLLILTSFIFSYTYYYNSNITYNNLTYILWSFLEDINYLVAYSFWTLTFTVSFLIHRVYNTVFNSFYGTQHPITQPYAPNNLTTKIYKPSKNFQSPIFISFLTNPNHDNVHLIEQLFSQNNSQDSWNKFYTSFKSLYNTNFTLSNLKNSLDLGNLTTLNTSFNYALTDLPSTSNIASWTILKSSTNSNLNKLTTSTNSEWNLYSFSAEINKYNNLIVGKKNLFYLNTLNFNTLNNLTTNYRELLSLSQSLIDQTKVVKWNRWLYRYNVLHRKTIKNSHKLTMVKKLLSTGFYDTSMMTNNMWTSTFFSKTTKPLFDKTTLELLHSQFNLLYKDTFNNSQLVSSNFNELNMQSPSSPLNMLRYFEKSYFWFVKRFYMYNTLNTNTITSSITLEQNTQLNSLASNLNDTFTKYSLLLNSLTRSSYLTTNLLNPASVHTIATKSNNQSFVTNLKDITVINSDFEIFNIDNLEIITNYNTLLNNSNTDFHFFNNNEYANNLSNTTLTFNSNKVHPKVNPKLTSNLTNLDIKLLNDLYILMLLNK